MAQPQDLLNPIELRTAGTFLMPPLFRFATFRNHPDHGVVWAHASSSDKVHCLLCFSHQACTSLLKAEDADQTLLQSNLQFQNIYIPVGTPQPIVFPLLSVYTGLLSVDETGYMLEFSGESADRRIVIALSSVAYEELLSQLKDVFPQGRY
ncbi:MAG TPA: hypothetical protein VMO00_18135 [Methylomirabilota bacterium]|nr:hypothetical protein [Methylomirabilota bacterium]